MVCGDNSNGQLWCKNDIQATSTFIEANDFPYRQQIPLISQISAYDQSIAFLLSDQKVAFRDSNGNIQTFQTGIIHQIQCTENTVLILGFDKRIYDCVAHKYFEGGNYSQLAKSDTFLCSIDLTTKNVVLFSETGQRKSTIDVDAKLIACTNENIFIVTENGVKRYDGNEIFDVKSDSQIIFVAASQNEAAFIDVNGCVWVYDSDSLLQVFGLPPIVYLSVGIQHFAAISFDGDLFTWGFNPSGQLGIGSDRPTNDPIFVLSNSRIVACGTHHTVVITGGKPIIPETMNKSCLKKYAPSHTVKKMNSCITEILN